MYFPSEGMKQLVNLWLNPKSFRIRTLAGSSPELLLTVSSLWQCHKSYRERKTERKEQILIRLLIDVEPRISSGLSNVIDNGAWLLLLLLSSWKMLWVGNKIRINHANPLVGHSDQYSNLTVPSTYLKNRKESKPGQKGMRRCLGLQYHRITSEIGETKSNLK